MAEDDPTLREFLEQRIDDERDLRKSEERNLEQRLRTVEKQDGRIERLEQFKENLAGRMIGFGVIGAIFVAVSSAVVTRVIFGG